MARATFKVHRTYRTFGSERQISAIRECTLHVILNPAGCQESGKGKTAKESVE